MTHPYAPKRPQYAACQPDTAQKPGHAAAELHGQVVQAIFAVGLHLQSTAEITVDPLVRRRLERALSDLDDLVHIIRDTVFRLDYHLNDPGPHPGTVHLLERSPSPTPPSPGW